MNLTPSADPKFTATEQRLLAVLNDGDAHEFSELKAVLNDDMALRGTLRWHIFSLRRKLKPLGRDIFHRGTTYRQVRLLTPEDRS